MTVYKPPLVEQCPLMDRIMTTKEPQSFIEWLDQELEKRGWSDYRLSKAAQISHSVFSRARAGTPPGWDACVAIARALRLPPEEVMRIAGLLPKAPEQEKESLELVYLFNQLPPEDQDEILEFIRLKLSRLEISKKGTISTSRRARK